MSLPPALLVRDATAADAAACAAIYAPFVLGTAVSFESDPPDEAEVARRIAAAQERHGWLVADGDGDGDVAGYAYATAWRARAAYRWTCETSVYVGPGRQGSGVGRALYEALLEQLARRGFRTAVAGMTLPNPASAGLHAALGFTRTGVLARVGWKHGRWHDVAFYQRGLGPEPYGPGEPGEPV